MYFLFLHKIFGVGTGSFFSKIAVLSLFLLLCYGTFGQNVNIIVDSTKVVEVEPQQEIVHSPKKATIYSAVLPGLGQAYNKQYWKIPLIYAGFGTFGYFIGWNNDYYKKMKLAYSDLNDDDETTTSYLNLNGSEYYDFTDETDVENFNDALTNARDYYRRNRDLLIICTALFYGINIVDAAVDANFFDFDMSEDLSFNWQPSMQYCNEQPVYGFSCSFTF